MSTEFDGFSDYLEVSYYLDNGISDPFVQVDIIQPARIETSAELKTMWGKYRKQFTDAQNITCAQIMDSAETLLENTSGIKGVRENPVILSNDGVWWRLLDSNQ